MAIRYLAVVDSQCDRRRAIAVTAARTTGLLVSFDQGCLTLLTSSPTPVLESADSNVVVVGDLFTRGPNAPSSATVRPNMTASELLRERWGAYVAFIGVANGLPQILRDPSGALPCFYTTVGTKVFASDAGIISAAGLLEATIDWQQLAWHLGAGDLLNSQTCLRGVHELLAGHILSPAGQTWEMTQAWSPWNHVRQRSGLTIDGAASELRETVLACVRAWTSRYSKPLLSVSGGLDSSILAAAFIEAGADLECYTMFTDDPDGDERHYACIIADHLGFHLHEASYDSAAIDACRTSAGHLPRPAGQFYAQAQRSVAANLGADLATEVFASGMGGDHVFCYLPSASLLVDRIRSEHSLRGLIRSIDDLHRVTGSSFGKIASRLLSRRCWEPRAANWKDGGLFLSREALRHVDAPLHPWLAAPAGFLPGKHRHIDMLARVQPYIDSYSHPQLAPALSPLLSQPILECCLAIPTWMWCAGGQDRSIARRAFAPLLPKAIVSRRTKGGPDAFALSALESRRGELNAFLESGRLAAAGIIDLPSIRNALLGRSPLRPPASQALYWIAGAEAWARSWEERNDEPSVTPHETVLTFPQG